MGSRGLTSVTGTAGSRPFGGGGPVAGRAGLGTKLCVLSCVQSDREDLAGYSYPAAECLANVECESDG